MSYILTEAAADFGVALFTGGEVRCALKTRDCGQKVPPAFRKLSLNVFVGLLCFIVTNVILSICKIADAHNTPFVQLLCPIAGGAT
jgi:hypothetical protein